MTPARNDHALALAVWPESVNTAVKSVVLVLVGSFLLAISAKISVPFWPVPMTLQTFAVMAIAAAYGSRLAVATVLAYLVEGFVGLPVFAVGAAAGPAYFVGPTAGFLYGFVVLAFLVGLAADRGWSRSAPLLFAALLVADVLVFAMGFGWFAWFGHFADGSIGRGPAVAFERAVQPFLLADLLKIALVALAIPAGWRVADSFRSAR